MDFSKWGKNVHIEVDREWMKEEINFKVGKNNIYSKVAGVERSF